MLLLLNLLCYSCLICCYAFLARPFCLGTFVLRPWFCYSLLLLFNLAILLLLFQIGTPPSPLLQVWNVVELVKFKFFQTWKVRIFVFNFCLLMNFLNYPCFWEMVFNNVFVFLCRNYLNIIHLIIHIPFHLHNYIMYFLNILHFIFLSIACKCLGWFSYSW